MEYKNIFDHRDFCSPMFKYESIIFFCKVNSFNHPLICLCMEYKNIFGHRDLWGPVFKYENHDIHDRFEKSMV